MKLRKLSIALTLFVGAVVTAHSETFNYSFTVGSGQPTPANISGSFDGTLNGNLISGLSHIFASLNGVEVIGSGSLFSAGWDAGLPGFGTNAIISIDGTQNNFTFSDLPFLPGNSPTFSVSSFAPNVLASGTPSIQRFYSQTIPPFFLQDTEAVPTNWSVTVAAPVPEPETFAMLLAGLGLIYSTVKRRKEKQA
jgi:hypothetical protein